MGSFVDELNTICKGKCKECQTKACSWDEKSEIYNSKTNCFDCTEQNCSSCFKKDGFEKRGGARVC